MNHVNNNRVKEILGYIDAQKKISQENIEIWMKSQDIETLGITFFILNERQHLIEGFPSMRTILQFYRHFFRRCLQENPSGEFALNRYIAGYTLTNLYKALRNDPVVPPEELSKIRAMIREVYEQGDEDIKNCIICSILEHLFEDREIAEEFVDWSQNRHLKDAYHQALEFSQK